jgi:hypothetical protein
MPRYCAFGVLTASWEMSSIHIDQVYHQIQFQVHDHSDNYIRGKAVSIQYLQYLHVDAPIQELLKPRTVVKF